MNKDNLGKDFKEAEGLGEGYNIEKVWVNIKLHWVKS